MSAVPNGPSGEEPLIFMSKITRDLERTDRSIRQMIAAGRFPRPDGKLNGRSYWLLSTYLMWRRDVAAGKYSQVNGSENSNSNKK